MFDSSPVFIVSILILIIPYYIGGTNTATVSTTVLTAPLQSIDTSTYTYWYQNVGAFLNLIQPNALCTAATAIVVGTDSPGVSYLLIYYHDKHNHQTAVGMIKLN